MPSQTQTPSNNQLSIIYRLEPGCLGPDGTEKIDAFCQIAQQHFQQNTALHIGLQIEPRFDKSLPEMEFALSGKKLNREQAQKYLDLFSENLTSFENELADQLATDIDAFLAGNNCL